MFVAIDRVSKFAFAELHEKATRRIAAEFLRHLIDAVPYKIHTVLTDNGTHFTTPGAKGSGAPEIKAAIERREIFRAHAFELTCARNDIEHRLTKPNHPRCGTVHFVDQHVARLIPHEALLYLACPDGDLHGIPDDARQSACIFLKAERPQMLDQRISHQIPPVMFALRFCV